MSLESTLGIDIVSVVGVLVVFTLPLTLLIPEFCIWDYIPKVRVTRFHAYAQHLTWSQLNGAIVAFLVLFFCLYLEIKKRNLDDMVQSVLNVSEATNKTMDMEKQRQMKAVRVCVNLLDASAEHYENLVLLREEMRRRTTNQHPPVIESSSSFNSARKSVASL